MKKHLTVSLLATLVSAGTAHASTPGPTAELTISGHHTPSACTIVVGNNATIDYGTISAKTITEETATDLGTKTLADVVTVQCATPTLVGIGILADNRKTSVAPDVTDINLYPKPEGSRLYKILGLGYDSAGNPLGGYSLYFSNLRVDGVVAKTTTSPGGFISDMSPAGLSDYISFVGDMPPGMDYGFYDKDGKVLAGEIFTLDANVNVLLTKNKLDFSDTTMLDGSVSVQVDYL